MPASPASFTARTIEDFAAALAAGEPTPGGGAAAALMAKLAAALVQMACNHTLGRARYAAVEGRVADLRAEAAELSQQAGALMDADAAAFQGVSAALRLAKEDPARAERLSAAYKQATEVPLQTARLSAHLMHLAVEIGEIGNRSLLFDARTAFFAAEAALNASLGNIDSNTRLVSNAAWQGKVRQEAAQLLGSAPRLPLSLD